jgi:hypothetical protein
MDTDILDNYIEVDNYTEEYNDIDSEGNDMLGNMIVEEHALHHKCQTTILQALSNKLPEALPSTILQIIPF